MDLSNPYSGDRHSTTLYEKLTTTRFTEYLNDAALCLRSIGEKHSDLVSLCDPRTPLADIAIRTLGLAMCLAIRLSGSEKVELRNHQGTGLFSEKFINVLQRATPTKVPRFQHPMLKMATVTFLLGLHGAFSDKETPKFAGGPFQLQISLLGASENFLTMACDIEGLPGTRSGYTAEEVTERVVGQDFSTDLAEAFEEAASEVDLFTTALSALKGKMKRLNIG